MDLSIVLFSRPNHGDRASKKMARERQQVCKRHSLRKTKPTAPTEPNVVLSFHSRVPLHLLLNCFLAFLNPTTDYLNHCVKVKNEDIKIWDSATPVATTRMHFVFAVCIRCGYICGDQSQTAICVHILYSAACSFLFNLSFFIQVQKSIALSALNGILAA